MPYQQPHGDRTEVVELRRKRRENGRGDEDEGALAVDDRRGEGLLAAGDTGLPALDALAATAPGFGALLLGVALPMLASAAVLPFLVGAAALVFGSPVAPSLFVPAAHGLGIPFE
jgi:hypothetical protein